MRLNSFHLDALRAVDRGDIDVSSSGFELEGEPITDQAERDHLDYLWLNDFIDADLGAPDASAKAFLTEHGRRALARAEQESNR